jgi:hypothetical protein
MNGAGRPTIGPTDERWMGSDIVYGASTRARVSAVAA